MIRVIALCVFRRGDKILVAEGLDAESGLRYARPLGGGIELGETSLEAMVREIREEIAQEVVDLQLLGVLENIFTYFGEPKHEIVFVYDAAFADESVYDLPEITLLEPGWETSAMWRSLNWFGDHCQLVPTGLPGLLGQKIDPFFPGSS